uniref:Serine and arginine rich splicing factor 11 n=1 Tax=Suricata suricatta TaxID=37032 RepID=A0A673UI21_SURSU
MSNTTVVPSTAGPGPSGGPGGGGGGGGGGGTEVIQVTNVSPSASSEQMRTLFGFLGKIDELRLFPPEPSPTLPGTRLLPLRQAVGFACERSCILGLMQRSGASVWEIKETQPFKI